MIRSEIYISKPNNGLYRIDIYSHVKHSWVYNSELSFWELFSLFKDLGVNRENCLIRTQRNHLLYYALLLNGFSVKYHRNSQ